MANKKKDLSYEDFQVIYGEALSVIGRIADIIHNMNLDMRQKSTRIFALIAILGFAGTVGWYIVTADGAPLLIFVSLAVPVLAMLILDQAKTFKVLVDEYLEYTESISALLASLGRLAEQVPSDDVTIALASALSAATTVAVEDLDRVQLGDLRNLPQYDKAVQLSKALTAVNQTLHNMREEGLDVNKILEELEADPDRAIDELTEFTNALYESKQNHEFANMPLITVEPHTEVPPVPLPDPEPESSPHIIYTESDSDTEDLTIVV